MFALRRHTCHRLQEYLVCLSSTTHLSTKLVTSQTVARYSSSKNLLDGGIQDKTHSISDKPKLNLSQKRYMMSQQKFKTPEEKEAAIDELSRSQWARVAEKDAIRKKFLFKNFVQAFSFMTAVALESEKIDHHPEWFNVYNQVEITLTSHFCNGVSQLDIQLAKVIDDIYSKTSNN